MSLQPNPAQAAALLTAIAGKVTQIGGRVLIVGGAVRDKILGLPEKDVDIEVYNVEPGDLEKLIRKDYEVDLVGKSFGILKIKGHNIDISLPRRDSKYGHGHKDFTIHSDPQMSVKEASSRRDFTINSMAFDPLTKELIDHYGGQEDLKNKILKHTSPAFVEDPLRVLRGMQFIARFNLTAAPETIELCKTMDMSWLSSERVYEEWCKLMLKGIHNRKALHFLLATNWLRFFPELEKLVGVQQDPEWHPEGDVFEHTGYCMDAHGASKTGNDHDDLVVGFATLLHDSGKPAVTALGEDGRWHAYAHEERGVAPTIDFMTRMTHQTDFINQILPLVANHMVPGMLYEAGSKDSAVRRLAVRVGRIDLLCRVVLNDQGGRPPLIADKAATDWTLEKANSLAVVSDTPKPYVMGRHLIALGMTPGKGFREILDACFEAQLEGTISNEESGIIYAKGIITAKAEKKEATINKPTDEIQAS